MIELIKVKDLNDKRFMHMFENIALLSKKNRQQD